LIAKVFQRSDSLSSRSEMALAYEECASKSCCSFSTSAAHGADIWCGSLHQCHVDEWPRTTVLNPRSNLAAYTSSIAHKARILWRKMLMRKLRLIFAGAALCGGLTAATAASAMPIAPIQADRTAQVEQVRWVCGPYRCWWRPNYYGGYYGAYAYYPHHRYWRHRYWRRHHHYW
jgi:hypothetical protein